MAERKTSFIKVEGLPEGSHQTIPTKPEDRLPDSDIRIEACDESDADKIAYGLYNIFPDAFWTHREPISTRPPPDIRQARMAARILPTLTIPTVHWIKAIHNPTNTTMGIAGWVHPSNPGIHNHLGRSAFTYYHLQSKMNWSDAYVREIWSSIDEVAWDADITKGDERRAEIMGDTKHWYLAPLMVWPEWQGRGVGRKLMDWAIGQADAEVPTTHVFLESAPTARGVYLHLGFEAVGEKIMVRRESLGS